MHERSRLLIRRGRQVSTNGQILHDEDVVIDSLDTRTYLVQTLCTPIIRTGAREATGCRIQHAQLKLFKPDNIPVSYSSTGTKLMSLVVHRTNGSILAGGQCERKKQRRKRNLWIRRDLFGHCTTL